MKERVFLKGIAYSLGDSKDIEEIEELQKDEGLEEAMRLKGLSRFLDCNGNIIDLMKDAVRQTIANTKTDPEEIDAVIFASFTSGIREEFSRPGINRLLNDLKLFNAYPYGVSLSECANLATAFQVANGLLVSKQKKKVLLIIADRLREDTLRLMNLGMAVLSDGAASCILELNESGDYEFLGVSQHSTPSMDELNFEQNLMDYFKFTAKGLKKVVGEIFNNFDIGGTDITKLITNNYALNFQKLIAKSLGFKPTQCFYENVGQYGHVFAADGLINLTTCDAKGELEKDNLLLLLGTSPSSWGGILLRK